MAVATQSYRFPEGFLWGAGTVAAQVEGSPLADGASPSIIHRWANTPGNTPPGETDDVTCDHYRRFRSDVALMADFGLQAYRFSIGWSRVLPDGTGTVNQAGLDFYDRLVDELLTAGVAPAPQLYVWDMPGALQDRGGWPNRDSAEWFGEFAAVVFERLGDRATHWITLCESYAISHSGHISGQSPPSMRDLYAGLRAAHHLHLAHGRAVEAFRASGIRGEIGTDTELVDVQAASDSEADRAAAERVRAYVNKMHLDPIMKGEYPQEIVERFAPMWPPVADGDMSTISAPIDFVGVSYYLGWKVADAGSLEAAERPPGGIELSLAAVENLLGVSMRQIDASPTGLAWPVHPEGLVNVLKWLDERYDHPAFIVTENGAAYPDVVTENGTVEDRERLEYIRDHLIAAHRAIEEGIDLRGWFVWSFTDTWGYWLGFETRFGLVHVNYETQERTIKASGNWYRDVMATNGFDVQAEAADS